MKPPILILQHYKERLAKCSLQGLRGRPGIEFRTVRPPYSGAQLEVPGGILLTPDAAPLSAADRRLLERDRHAALIIVDGTWVNVAPLVAGIRLRAAEGADAGGAAPARLIRRALAPGLSTAYPRRSKIHRDPENGLASIEALAVALCALGFDGVACLEGYRWRDAFIERNAPFLAVRSPADHGPVSTGGLRHGLGPRGGRL